MIGFESGCACGSATEGARDASNLAMIYMNVGVTRPDDFATVRWVDSIETIRDQDDGLKEDLQGELGLVMRG